MQEIEWVVKRNKVMQLIILNAYKYSNIIHFCLKFSISNSTSVFCLYALWYSACPINRALPTILKALYFVARLINSLSKKLNIDSCLFPIISSGITEYFLLIGSIFNFPYVHIGTPSIIALYSYFWSASCLEVGGKLKTNT